MQCERCRELLMGALDGELDAADRLAVAEHLASCAACHREEAEFRRLKEVTQSMRFLEPTDRAWEEHWRGIYNRLERGIGWILVSLGALCLLSYGAYQFTGTFLRDPAVPLIVRIGAALGLLGILVLLLSVARERWIVRRSERYKEVIR